MTGVVGSGFVGGNLANAIHADVLYSLDPKYVHNKKRIAECSVVFIATPTPTVNGKQNISSIRESLGLLSNGSIAVIKSTILPGTTETLQKEFPHLTVMHSPEFLTEKNAKHDTEFPERNIIGIVSPEDTEKAQQVLGILPVARETHIVFAHIAEAVKYAGNIFLTMKVVYGSVLAEIFGKDYYEEVAHIMGGDSRIGHSHLKVEGGAGGHCFPKDLSAFVGTYNDSFLKAIETRNLKLLRDSGKDPEIVNALYGKHERIDSGEVGGL